MIDKKVVIGGGRIPWIDTAKGLGVILVFWGHLLYGGSAIGGVINRAIYSFHMPMFFILSGYVLKDDNCSILSFIKAKFKRILLPALIFYILTYPIFVLEFVLGLDVDLSIKSILYQTFYVTGRCAYNDPIWFFICLFQVLCLWKLFRLKNAGLSTLLAVTLGCFICSFLMSFLNIKWFSLFGVNKAVLGLGFLCVGNILERLGYGYNNRMSLMLGLISLPLWLLFGVVLNGKVSMYGADYGNFVCFILSGIFGSFSIFCLSKMVDKWKFPLSISKWTTIIVCSHYVLVSMFHFFAKKIEITGMVVFDFVSFAFGIFALLLYVPASKFIVRYLPVLNGNRK